MDRREFVRAVAATGGGLALFGTLAGLPAARAAGSGATGRGYGELGRPDRNGVALPAGFRSRIVATSGRPVGGTGYVWHPNPDGGATFAQPDGGWIYVSNDETGDGRGGASMLRFDRSGSIVEAASVLSGTNRNCAGGPTPWGSWLSCEEADDGRVWECDPTGRSEAIARPALGVLKHEAAAADSPNRVIYLTEDQSDGALYRFRPDVWGDLTEGTLEVMTESSRTFGWSVVPDPAANTAPTRGQVATTKRFNGGEGAWFDGAHLYFTTKGDNRVWRYDPADVSLTVLYDIATAPNPVLGGVDNVTVSGTGDIYVCEDGGNMELVVLSADGAVTPFLRIDVAGSELTGVAFDPSGTRLYLSSQRNPGVTFEITGPFRRPASVAGAGTAARAVPPGAAAPLDDGADARRPAASTGFRTWF